MVWTTSPQLDPKLAFRAAKGSAKKRGIPWELSYKEWWQVWEPYWPRKGAGLQRYVLARLWDRGAYSPQNVSVVTIGENTREALLVRRLIAKGQITNK